LTALYAFGVESFVYRDLKIGRDAPRVMAQCAILVGGVLIILGVALGFTNYLVDAQIPARGVAWVKDSIDSPLLFLILLTLSPPRLPPPPPPFPPPGPRPLGPLPPLARLAPPHPPEGPGFRHRPRPSRDHLPGQHGIGIPAPAGGDEPVPGLLPFQPALAGG